MRRYNKILVPYDGSISTEYTLRTACRIARWNNSSVLVIVPFFADKDKSGEQLAINEGIRQISKEMEIPMSVLFQDGRPSATIIDVARTQENDLIVLGKTVMNALEKFVIGSITGRIIGHARCDVIVVPEDRLIRWNRLLLCTDGSRYSQAAVENAIAYARQEGKPINVAAVVDMTDEFFALSPNGATAMVEKMQQTLLDVTDLARKAGVEATPFLREGEKVEKIMEVVVETKADMIIMGSHSRTGPERLLMGSVARQVAMLADCPVFIIKPDQ